ncbi:pyridoxamine 5'-phosphate oxidase family protein [Prolixibacteraceae bacterium Z1-6]|uniref:Pyridoxamine 5'-phosphate oxidase family protein n=1 Tax=Draconibacterium aestuarii TaxID=2998507 RepID=A0A9X3FHL3_9BACT|nr:pyridoxamine 5'-phosphate oxidase family protein [Prolixibacteraceae bacterium Z1-6]
MPTSKKFISVLFVVFLFIPFCGYSQPAEANDTTQNKVILAAREIIQAAHTCALITLDEEGNTRVRTMDPFLPEENFTIWLGTNANSRKVKQIKKHPEVSLYYLDSDASGYVVIQGTSELINDKKGKKKWWKKEWEAFYPNKAETFLLIKITPKWIEVSSNTRGIYSDPHTWQPPRVVFE